MGGADLLMDTFSVERAFYEMGSEEELKDFWDTDLDPTMQEVLRVNGGGDLTVEWNLLEKDLRGGGVVLHDRFMTDAALGRRPIKTEHSYSCAASDADSLPDESVTHKMDDDMEDECFATMSMNANGNGRLLSSGSDHIIIKNEPLSEPDTPDSSCPASPQCDFANYSDDTSMDTDLVTQTLLKPAATSLIMRNSTSTHLFANHHRLQLAGMKVESFTLPPTPPSSAGCSGSSSGEESEDSAITISSGNNVATTPHTTATTTKSIASAIRKVSPTNRILLAHSLNPLAASNLIPIASATTTTSTRQPIHTPLISTQPKGSTGSLILTDEEKRTLIAEGYPVPTRLPLTKAEEKSLKKIRRKIKNKISAQESRRKKKEYMDQLERKVEVLVTENCDYRRKVETLEDSNASLMAQLAKLQAIVARTHASMGKGLAHAQTTAMGGSSSRAGTTTAAMVQSRK